MTLRSFFVAIQFLTRVPVPSVADFRPDDVSRASLFFPLVGLLLGVVLLLLAALSAPAGSMVAALLVVTAWIWITGALHIDGLGDIADAFGAAHRDPARFLEVLRDPHMGTFGVLAIVLQVLAKFVFVDAIIRLGAPLLGLALVPAWARWTILVVSHWTEPLATGSGARFKMAIAPAALAGNLAALVVASAFLAPALLVAPFIAAGFVLYWRTVTGGITGDCLGASVELTESALLLALVVVATLLR
jgi:adenosylcobinamide-GDP ribazoletransferase